LLILTTLLSTSRDLFTKKNHKVSRANYKEWVHEAADCEEVVEDLFRSGKHVRCNIGSALATATGLARVVGETCHGLVGNTSCK
jgi:hypothetical protein